MIKDRYEDEDLILHIKMDSNDEPYIEAEAVVEEITRHDITTLYKNVLRYKPKNIPIGEFTIKICDGCNFEGLLHIKQTFCPLCYDLVSSVGNFDPNDSFEVIFQTWQKRKNLIENLLNGNILKFLDDINNKTKFIPEGNSVIGEEVLVDEKW